MGSLATRHYPTKLFLGAADHTYVECGTGQVGWSCWGGKANGALLRSAMGSTRRADAIAEPNERAGITCYLVNGVCHQAANRILLPAAITVDGVRGYDLSVSFFGLYGRPKAAFGLCKAPFHKHGGVNGDLPECSGGSHADPDDKEGIEKTKPLDFRDQAYMSAVMSSYDALSVEDATNKSSLFDFQIEQFKLFVSHKLPRSVWRIQTEQYHRLMVARESFERERLDAEAELAETNDGLAFVEEFDRLTLAFQSDVAQALDEEQYRALLDLSPDERIVLSDPDIVKAVYEPPTGPRGMAP